MQRKTDQQQILFGAPFQAGGRIIQSLERVRKKFEEVIANESFSHQLK